MTFTWIPFYTEFADKLLQFRHDRKSLLDWIYIHQEDLTANYLHDKDGDKNIALDDIDPFTVMGLFNRGLTDENRIKSATLFKELLKIQADVPQDLAGIPILNNLSSLFFGNKGKRKNDDIENLWELFEKVINNENFESQFNKVIKQHGIKFNITMGLFWIRPNNYLALDGTNRKYLSQQYDIKSPRKTPEYKEYIQFIQSIKEKMSNGNIKEKTFCELSRNAWTNDELQDEDETIDEEFFYIYYTKALKKRKNIVLQGAPGTGKTYCVPEVVVRLCEPEYYFNSDIPRDELMEIYNKLKEEKRVMFTTFHQSMDYEDWLEGLRPVVNNNQVTYKIEPGIFKKLCEEAEKSETEPYVIVIDEFNRGNVSKIFGELITLLEPDKRKGEENAESVILPYSKQPFYIPSNVYMIATMNTADRSLGTIDYAIRRRFTFLPVKPQSIVNKNFNEDLFREVSNLFISNYDEYVKSGFNDTLRLLAAETLSKEYRPEDVWIGQSYFIMENEDDIEMRLLYEIIPLLEEYIRDGILTANAQETVEKLRQRATKQ